MAADNTEEGELTGLVDYWDVRIEGKGTKGLQGDDWMGAIPQEKLCGNWMTPK